ncbi:MAG: peptidyl-tRNA hydrolase Pth2 [Desulfurococcaceae archaeon]|jgi:PTH2 family peptidyl-tRNA hydrolase|nr:peptidyl-tRNA hydrolase Pth2 [Desulfurococcaceae archaeon]
MELEIKIYKSYDVESTIMMLSAESKELKLVIVIRTDIKMSKGKIAVQVAHAAVECILRCLENSSCRSFIYIWREQGQKKVVAKVKSLEELLHLKTVAEGLNINTALIADAGLTELPPGTITALGLGPAPSHILDKITGHLPLL